MANTFPMPRINLNGTSKEQLREEYMAAYTAIEEARGAVAAITVHDRDYHMLDSRAGERARDRKTDWLLALANIHQDLTDVMLHLTEEPK